MYYTYVIQSLTTGMFYIGQTKNLEDRLKRHNHNRNKFTKGKGPWKLVFVKSFTSRTEAVALEKKLKALKNRTALNRVQCWFRASRQKVGRAAVYSRQTHFYLQQTINANGFYWALCSELPN